jgi:hypothetical protein
MRDRPVILGGLLALLAALTVPIWYNLAAGKASRPPDLRLPSNEKNCVAPVAYMRTSHMELLIEWRDQVVRNGVRTYQAFDGRTHRISLSRTCLGCHDRKEEFCDRCHDYAAVKPACWNCHVDPAQVGKGTEYARR